MMRQRDINPHHRHEKHVGSPCQAAALVADEAETAASKILQKKLPKGVLGLVIVMTQFGECKNGGMSGNIELDEGVEDNEKACLLYARDWIADRLDELDVLDGTVVATFDRVGDQWVEREKSEPEPGGTH